MNRTDSRIGVRAAVVVGLVLTLAGSPAGAVEYTFTRIADTSSFKNFGSSPVANINAGGTVAFYAGLLDGRYGIYTGAGGPITTLAETGTPQFSALGGGPTLNTAGEAGFSGGLWSVHGLYLSSGGTITTLLDNSGSYDLFSRARINDAGQVGFRGNYGGTPGIFRYDGATVKTVASQGSAGFASFSGGIDMNGAGMIAFKPFLSTGDGATIGIYIGDGTVTTRVAADNGPFKTFGGSAINDSDQVLFRGDKDDGRVGTYLFDGADIIPIVETGSTFVDVGGTPSLNNLGGCAFTATLAGGQQGLFTGPDPLADKVILTGEKLFGASVVSLVIERDAINDGGQIAFYAKLSNGTEGLYRADPVPEPATLGLLVMGGAAAACGRRLRRRARKG